jgi:hypothetical protein
MMPRRSQQNVLWHFLLRLKSPIVSKWEGEYNNSIEATLLIGDFCLLMQQVQSDFFKQLEQLFLQEYYCYNDSEDGRFRVSRLNFSEVEMSNKAEKKLPRSANLL